MFKQIFFLLNLFFISSLGICGQLWVQNPSNPIITISAQAWEAKFVGEPNVINFGGTNWVGFYTGTNAGETQNSIGRMTSTDGKTWTKYGFNPVIGNGFGNEAGDAAHFGLYYDGTTLYIFYCNVNSGASDLIRQQSTDQGITWTNKTTVISVSSQAPASVIGFVTSSIIKVGSTYHMLIESDVTTGSHWNIFHWTSTDLTNWTVQNSGNALSTLQQHSGGCFGGPNLHNINGTYYLWYHACTASGTGPLAGFLSLSPDLNDDFTTLQSNFLPFGNQVNTSLITGSPQNVGDIRAVEVNGLSYLYHNRSADDSTSDIAVETFNGTLSQLISLISTNTYGSNISIYNGSLQ